jgi:AcrR family transcriptional regulator
MPILVNPRKRPVQSRSKETCEAILAAAARILEERGLEAANTNAIAELAGVGVGSLYQYFPGKEAIFAELIRREERGVVEGLEGLVAGTAGRPLEERLRLLVRVGVEQQLTHPRLARLLDSIETTLPEDETLRALERRILDLIRRVLRDHADEVEREPSRTTARDVLAMVKGMVDAAGFAGETRPGPLEKRVFLAVVGYLRQPEPRRRTAAKTRDRREEPTNAAAKLDGGREARAEEVGADPDLGS